MRHYTAIILAVLLTAFAAPAFAAGECYNNLEAEAEQGIRIHSELMVIGLNCQHMARRHNINLYGQYREITSRYADLFAMYEDTLMKFYKKRGDKNPEATLNTVRTGFANKISTDAASMRPDIFCGTYAPRIEKVYQMKLENLRQWAGTVYESHPVSYPLCKG